MCGYVLLQRDPVPIRVCMGMSCSRGTTHSAICPWVSHDVRLDVTLLGMRGESHNL